MTNDKSELFSQVSDFITETHLENPELLEKFLPEMLRSTKPERSWITGFGYPNNQSYVHFFYLSAQSVCGRHIHHGTLWRDVEAIDRICGDCMDAVIFMMESRSEIVLTGAEVGCSNYQLYEKTGNGKFK